MLRLQERDEEGRREGAALSAGVRTLSKGGSAAMAAGLMGFGGLANSVRLFAQVELDGVLLRRVDVAN